MPIARDLGSGTLTFFVLLEPMLLKQAVVPKVNLVNTLQCNTVSGWLGIKLLWLQSQPSAPGLRHSCHQCVALANGRVRKAIWHPFAECKG